MIVHSQAVLAVEADFQSPRSNMSWIGELAGGAPPPRYVDDSTDKVADPNIPGRMVSNKSANRPFLAYVSVP